MAVNEIVVQTANEFTNVKDVRDIFLYGKDGYIYCYIAVPQFSIDLLPDAEKESKTKNVSNGMKGDRKMFAYQTFPRALDLDEYKSDLKDRYKSEVASTGKKWILSEMLKTAIELSNGENYEHQHYIKLWQPMRRDRTESERELRQRAEEFRVRYQNIGIAAEILKEQAILKMCNLFGNAVQAPYEDLENYLYETTLKI